MVWWLFSSVSKAVLSLPALLTGCSTASLLPVCGSDARRLFPIHNEQRKSTMMKKEYPKKVSLVGTAYQVRELTRW